MILRLILAFALAAVASSGSSAPVERPLAEVAALTVKTNGISTCGTVVDIFPDDVDTKNSFLILRDGADSLLVALYVGFNADLANLLDAEISVTGDFKPYQDGGARWFSPPYLSVAEPARDIRVLRAPPEDPFAIPELSYIHHATPKEIAGLGKRKIVGTVRCCWGGRNVLIRTDRLRNVKLELAPGQSVPARGTIICAAGYPTTDFFKIILRNAIWKPTGETAALPAPTPTTAGEILTKDGQLHITHKLLGQPIRIRGVVRTKPNTDEGRLQLECDGFLIGIDRGTIRDAFNGIEIGSTIEATGICVFEPEKQNWLSTFPRLNDFFVVIDASDALTVISAVSWWTPMRMTAYAALFFVILVAILLWNRMLSRMIDRRSQELADEQTAHIGAVQRTQERTRLAVELHDSLSQNLAGVAFQVSAAAGVCHENPEVAATHLGVAGRILKSTRTELKRCLWDLRENTIDDPDFASAVRKTLNPVSGNAELRIRFNVPRARFTDTNAYAVLRILRELAANAVLHGKAKTIRVSGEWHEGTLSLSVADDGVGFNMERHPGPEEGHFGLDGIQMRIRDLGGTFDLESAPGCGTKAVITLPMSVEDREETDEKR